MLSEPGGVADIALRVPQRSSFCKAPGGEKAAGSCITSHVPRPLKKEMQPSSVPMPCPGLAVIDTECGMVPSPVLS